MIKLSDIAENYIFDKYECPCVLAKAPSGGYKVAATLTALVRESNNFLKKRKTKCTPNLQKIDEKQQRFYFNVVCNESYSNSSGHTVRIRFKRKSSKKGGFEDEVKKLDVRIACSCPSFLYWGPQYYAKKDGYLDGSIRGIYKEPETNDVGKLYVCKHIASVLQLFKKYTIEWDDKKIKGLHGPLDTDDL